MKINTLIIALLFVGSLFGQSDFFYRADAFFKSYTKDGRVNYNALRETPQQLNWLVDHLAETPIKKSTEKAYLINAYNILVIDKLVKHPNLVKNPLNISNFFEAKTATLASQKVSLNQIENELIRPVYNDPRVHFVLVCGGLGCPPIASFAYMPNQLEAQLDSQTKKALNNESFVYTNPEKKTVYISKIFEWYQSDFATNQKGVISYINGYRTDLFNPAHKIRYYDYDWSINNAVFPIKLVTPLASTDVAAELKDASINDENIDTENITNTTIETTTIPVDETNLQTFTAGSLLAKGKFDFTSFNTLYTESKQIWQGTEFSGYRATFVTNLVQLTYGISKSKRINLGLDLNFGSSGRANFTDDFSAISRAFAYKNNDTARVALNSAGIRLKIQPFKEVSNFSIQSTLSIPTVKNPEGFIDNDNPSNNRYWATWDRITWWNQLFLDKTFGKFQLFTELDFLFRFKRYDSQIGMLDLPASVFLSYFPTSKITLYAMTQHVARFTNNINGHDPIVTDWVIPMNYTASGVGFKYQVLSNLNIELLYSNFWRGKNTGLGNTFNIGIKFLTR